MSDLLSDRLRDWLADKDDGEIVGQRNASSGCPVARMLLADGAAATYVSHGVRWWDRDGTRHVVPISPDDRVLWAFIGAIDNSDALSRSVTAAEARRILAEVSR